MPRMATSRTALALAFEKYNPRRPVTWRWRLASKLANGKTKERPGRTDPLLARAVRFLRRLARCRTPGRLASLRRAEPDMFQAHDYYLNGGWSRVILEARLLAEMPIAEIAKRHGLSDEAVSLYAALFYDVASRLTARDYIVSKAIGIRRRTEMDSQQAERQLKRFAYFMGPLLVDMLADRVFDRNGAFVRELPDLGTAEGLAIARLRLLIELDKPNRSLSHLLTLADSVKRLKEIEELNRRNATEPAKVLIDIALAEERLGPAPAAHHDAEEQLEEHPETAETGTWKAARTG